MYLGWGFQVFYYGPFITVSACHCSEWNEKQRGCLVKCCSTGPVWVLRSVVKAGRRVPKSAAEQEWPSDVKSLLENRTYSSYFLKWRHYTSLQWFLFRNSKFLEMAVKKEMHLCSYSFQLRLTFIWGFFPPCFFAWAFLIIIWVSQIQWVRGVTLLGKGGIMVYILKLSNHTLSEMPGKRN